ncbi:MAG: DUF4296 domain-containing protein [Bacteroidota bacterium]
MMRYIHILGWILLNLCVTVSCEEQQEEFEPLAPAVMQQILIEMHISDVVVDKRGGPLAMRRALREDLSNEILDKYALDRQTFLTHYKYYMEHPPLMNQIYQEITKNLEEREEQAKKEYAEKQLEEQAQKEAARKDSLKNLKADSSAISRISLDVE